MAPSTPITSTQEQLLQSLLPKIITTGKSRKYREAFNRRVKHHNYARTNQFEVIERLDGLEEKFQILNRDDLSDALRSRRTEIRSHENERRFLPDILDFLLRLSIEPTNIKRSDRLISRKEMASKLSPLRWLDIEENDPINHRDPIWQKPEYSDLSSDEDVFAINSIATSPQSVKRLQTKGDDNPLEHADKIFEDQPILEIVDLSMTERFGEEKEDGTVLLTELQASKECLFMLQGLPTKVYSSDNTIYAENTRYSLRNVNQEVFWDVLRSFAQIGKRMEFVRGSQTEVPTTRVTRTLQQSIAEVVSRFDAGIAEVQARLLRPWSNSPVGLLPCLEAATRCFKDVQVVWEYLRICESKKADPIRQLEVLFDLICSEQAAGKVVESLFLLTLFMPAFEMYLKPAMHWMKYGELHGNLGPFFVASAGQQTSLKNLWEGWFVLDEGEGANRAPRFLKQFSHAVFAMGKTTLFLRRLDDRNSNGFLEAHSLVPLEELTDALNSGYLGFAEIFAEAFGSRSRRALSQASARLYLRLDQQCGLWNVLNAFECIYFANRGPITDSIETTLFRWLDRCHTSWSDRFVISDLLESAFADVPELDTDCLVIHSSHTSSRSIQSRRKSVKVLGDLSINYSLPWQIANIIPQTCFASYRRISLLLMQIRRARYSLERRAHFHVMNPRLGSDLAEHNTSRALYQKLLLFGNILYSHLTTLVIDSSTSLMKIRLRQATTVDEMSRVLTAYITELEKACLTSKRLTPIRDTIVSILDLSIRFTDIVATPAELKPSDDDEVRSFRSAASRPRLRKQQQEDKDSQDEEEDEDSGDEGYSTFIVLDEPSPADEFKRLGKEFDRHLTFVIAGLKSLGRVDGEGTWDILAERLDWKRINEY